MKKIALLLIMVLTMAGAAGVTNAASLKNEISKDVKNFDGQVGLYAKNLKTGRVVDIHEDDVFPAASTAKLVVALATYKYLYPLVSQSKRQAYDEDIRNMIVISDNWAYSDLLGEADALKPDVFKKVQKDLRLRKTQIHSPEAFTKYQYHSVTTPAEMGKVMETIFFDQYVTKEQTNVLKYQLANTIFHDEIPRFMLTTVMHKVGELDDTLCDVGVVDDGKDQVLISVYTRTNRSAEYASDFIANISAKLYNELRRK